MAYRDFKNWNRRTAADRALCGIAFDIAKRTAYGDFKNWNRRTAADRLLRDKAFNIAKRIKHNRYQSGFALMVYNFDKKNFR